MLNEFAYCPRLMYLEWVDRVFVDSADTVEGRFVHRRVDDEHGDLAVATDGAADMAARSITLSDEALGLIARMDVVEARDGLVAPVEYKRGEPPDNPERSWEPERVQLCAQALILRQNGYRCELGIIYYAGSRQRVEVPITETLVARTKELLAALRETASRASPPPPLLHSPKCPRCSLVGICLPDEVGLLTVAPERQERVRRRDVRLLFAERPDARPLYVTEQGAYVGVSGERLVVRAQKQVLADVRLIDVSLLAVFGSVQVSTQALQELAGRDCPVLFFSHGGYFYGFAHGMPAAGVRLRTQQFTVGADVALALARAIVRTKLLNQRTLLRRNGRNLPEQVVPQLRALAGAALRARTRQALLGIEGAGSSVYFRHFSAMLSTEDDAGMFSFESRNRRPPRDPVNALLSFGYALLLKDLAVTAFAVGLDPYIGVYHQPGRGRPALALDLMEEFRPILVDSTVVNVINRGILTSRDFVSRAGAVALTPDGRRRFVQSYEQRLETLVQHPLFKYQVSYRRALELQLRLFARALTGELPRYIGFLSR